MGSPGMAESGAIQNDSTSVLRQRKPTGPRAMASGGSGPVLCGSAGRSPERVWTLPVLPMESLPTVRTTKGAGGRRQQGRTPMLVLTLAGLLLFRSTARQLCGSLNQEPPRSSWATRPHPSG
jgi:hypothetical protein